MTVYVSPLKVEPGGKESCELVGTNRDELDLFARSKLALTRDQRFFVDHTFYPLSAGKRREALRKGARELNQERWDELLKRAREW